MMTAQTVPGLRLTVLVGESDTWHHRPVRAEIVRPGRALRERR